MRRLAFVLLLGGCFFEPDRPADPVVATGGAQLAAGTAFACAIEMGTLKCWGRDDNGEAGVLPPTHFVPTPTALPGNWSAIAAGAVFACGIRDGDLVCWGTYGNVTEGGPTLVPLPGGAKPVKVFAGPGAVCATDANGTAYCLGDIGEDTYAQATPLVVDGNAGPWTAMAFGYHHQCAIDGGGHLYCWGMNSQDQLGTGDTTDRTRAMATPVPGYSFVAAAAGSSGTCAITTDHKLVCFGSGMYRQDVDGPPKLVDDHAWTAIASSGFSFVCGVRDGDAWCYGVNEHGALGDGFAAHDTFTQPAVTGVTEIAAGEEFACALGSDIRCWGSNQYGEMGNGMVATVFTPRPVAQLPNGTYSQIAAGTGHTCVLVGATPYCWGKNLDGQSVPTSMMTTVGPTMAITTPLSQLVATDSHTCGVTSAADFVECWGDGGAIGGGQARTSELPAPSSDQWYTVAVADNTSCASAKMGTITCTGDTPWTGSVPLSGAQVTVGTDFVGSCAAATADASLHYSTPSICGRAPSGPETLTLGASLLYIGASGGQSILGGPGTHVCALDTSNDLYCFGSNNFRQVSPTNVDCFDPMATTNKFERIGGPWSSFSVDGQHTCGLKNTELWCWGQNADGELGDIGPGADMPMRITGATQWAEVGLGLHHICAITKAGTEIDCWGLNTYGELGPGEHFHDTPSQVAF